MTVGLLHPAHAQAAGQPDGFRRAAAQVYRA
jgi:hypothetical protein